MKIKYFTNFRQLTRATEAHNFILKISDTKFIVNLKYVVKCVFEMITSFR